MCPQGRNVEQDLARFASGSHGVATHAELVALGLTARQIKHRVRRGDLIPQYRGVYRVGHAAPSLDARYLAAVRACGEGAVLCCLPAAYLWGLTRGDVPNPKVMTSTERRVPGVRTRRTRVIDRRHVSTFHGIPITTVPRTLADIAGVLDEDDLVRACHEAWIRYRVGLPEIEAVLAHLPRAKNRRTLLRIVGGDVHVVLSELEKRFLRLLRENGLPLPITNKLVDAHLVDCRWPDHRLTVELDSYRFHNTRYSWEQGYERERAAYARRDRYRRYTWRDVFVDPSRMLTELHELLASPAGSA